MHTNALAPSLTVGWSPNSCKLLPFLKSFPLWPEIDELSWQVCVILLASFRASTWVELKLVPILILGARYFLANGNRSSSSKTLEVPVLRSGEVKHCSGSHRFLSLGPLAYLRPLGLKSVSHLPWAKSVNNVFVLDIRHLRQRLKTQKGQFSHNTKMANRQMLTQHPPEK